MFSCLRSLLAVFWCVLLLSSTARAGEDVASLVTDQSFEDAAQSLQDAIVNRGFKIDYHGHISAMLDRTAADVGATQKLYNGAEIFTFCSAVLSRKVMEQDIADVAYCPYVLFVYQSENESESSVVGYRKLPAGGARDEVNEVLAEIIESAADGF